MKERVLTFGSNGNLLGVLCEPEPEQVLRGAPAALLWNVGIHHRVGPYRIFVEISRALARAGLTSLRFDISGLGDSEVTRNDPRAEHERGTADVQQAMKALEERCNLHSFLLVAFCSGVDSAHPVAVSDPRVAGIAYIEGYRFRTPGFYLRYPLRLLNRDRWERLLRVKAAKLFPERGGVNPGLSEPEQVYMRDLPTPEKFRRDVDKMVTENKRLLFVYAGGDTSYAYRDQFFDMLGRPELKSTIDVEFLPMADHIWYLEQDRHKVIDRVASWAKATFGPTSPPPERTISSQGDARAASGTTQ
jgi:hypothetical protein